MKFLFAFLALVLVPVLSLRRKTSAMADPVRNDILYTPVRGQTVLTGTVKKTYYGTSSPMVTEIGDRYDDITLSFSTPFTAIPAVLYSVTGIELNDPSGMRYYLKIMAVTAQGFTLRVGTWGNNQLAYIELSWLAIGS